MSLYLDATDTFIEFIEHILLRETFQHTCHHLTMCQDDGQRSAKLVGRNRQEFILKRICFTHRRLVCARNLRFLLPTCLLDSQTCKLSNTFDDCDVPDIEAMFQGFMCI